MRTIACPRCGSDNVTITSSSDREGKCEYRCFNCEKDFMDIAPCFIAAEENKKVKTIECPWCGSGDVKPTSTADESGLCDYECEVCEEFFRNFALPKKG